MTIYTNVLGKHRLDRLKKVKMPANVLRVCLPPLISRRSVYLHVVVKRTHSLLGVVRKEESKPGLSLK